MSQPDKRTLTAPCGLDCFNCEVYEENITGDMKDMLSERLKRPPEEIPCMGCRPEGGCRIFGYSCKTLECVSEKGIEFCFECDDFPCMMLAPAREGAERYPHNFKVFNLCRMKAVGVGRWAEEEALNIRQSYYMGRFIPGTGPVLSEKDGPA